MINLGLAVSTFTAQNYGAKEYNRILEGLKQALWIDIAWSIVYAILLVNFHSFFSSLFLPDASLEVRSLALSYFIINGSCYWILAILFIIRSFVQGLGKGFIPTLAGFGELIMRAGVAIIGSPIIWILWSCRRQPGSLDRKYFSSHPKHNYPLPQTKKKERLFNLKNA